MKGTKRMALSLMILCLAGCSLTIPKKPGAGSVWHLRPEVLPADTVKKPFGVVVAKPWLTSGYDTRQVLVSMDKSEIDGLAGVVWSANYGEWLRNYFIEGLQSSADFNSVTGNQSMRGQLVFLRLYVWDLSVHYEDDQRIKPVIKAKLGVSVTNGRGEKLVEQQIIESQVFVQDNRLTPIMAGFDRAVAECFEQTRAILHKL